MLYMIKNTKEIAKNSVKHNKTNENQLRSIKSTYTAEKTRQNRWV